MGDLRWNDALGLSNSSDKMLGLGAIGNSKNPKKEETSAKEDTSAGIVRGGSIFGHRNNPANAAAGRDLSRGDAGISRHGLDSVLAQARRNAELRMAKIESDKKAARKTTD